MALDTNNEDVWNSDPWKDDTWEDQELSEEEVIIEDPESINIDEEDEDGIDNQWFKSLMAEDEVEPEIYSEMRQDPYLSSWIPSKPTPKVNVSDNAKYAYNYLIEKGLPTHVSAGIVGNLMKESGVNPNSRDGDRRGGIGGIAQWDPSRSRSLVEFGQKSQRDPTNLDTQLDFIIHESQQRGDLEQVLSTKTPEEAAMTFGRRYERPSEKYADWETRKANARSLITKRQYGGRVAQYGADNIPEAELLNGVSDEAIQEYIEMEGIDVNNYAPNPFSEDEEENTTGRKVVNTVSAIQKGVNKFRQIKDKLNSLGTGAASTVSEAIDLQNEISGFQRNAASLRKVEELKNKKRYGNVQPGLNQPLTYT